MSRTLTNSSDVTQNLGTAGEALLNVVGAGGQALTLGGPFTTTGSGPSTLAFPNSTASYNLPPASDTLAGIGTAQTWSAVQTFANSAIRLLGSTAGYTTFVSANAGGTNYTLTFPAVTNTVSILGANTFTGTQTLPAGTTVSAPFVFQSGSNLTTASAGAMEFDGTSFYATSVASTRQVVATPQFTTVQGSAVSLSTTSTASQDIFATGGRVLSLAASTSYFFEGFFDFTTGTTTHTTALALAASSAFTSILYLAELWSVTNQSISTTAPSVTDVNTSSATVLNATSTASGTLIRVKGLVRTNAASTLTPQVAFSAGPGGTCQTNINSWFSIWPVGTNAVQAVGNWT